MNYSEEQIRKIKETKDVIAAKKYFADMHKEGSLADDELDNVSGGCGGKGNNIPEKVNIKSSNPVCPACGESLNEYTSTFLYDDGGYYDRFDCYGCGAKYRHHWDGDLWTKD